MKYFSKKRIWLLLAIIIIGISAIVIGGFWIGKENRKPIKATDKTNAPKLPHMVNLSVKTLSITSPARPSPSYPPDAPVLEQVRKALREGISPDDARILAKSLPESSEGPDATFLLLEYAADNGNADAALLVAAYFDPTADIQGGTISKNPEIANAWYQKALAGGQPKAIGKHLAQLQHWVQERAEQGSAEARQLVKSWH